MKRFILFGCSFIALFIASCLGSKNSEVSTISLAQKENAKALMLEEVPTNDVLEFAERCFVFDSILVVQNYSNSNKHLLEFVDLNTMKVKRKCIMRGNGPNEFIDIIANNSGNNLLIDAYMNNKFAKIDVAEYLDDEEAKIDYVDYFFVCQGLDLLNENHFIVVNPYRFINKEMKIEQDEPRFLILEGTDNIERDGLISAMNVNRGVIMINTDAQRICYYSRDIPEIEIYDFNFNLLKTVKGPDKMVPEYSISRQSVNYLSDIPQSYTYSCFDDSYMYLAYEGRILNAQEIIMSGGKIENSDTWIFKLDWKGNVKDSYKVDKDKKVKSLSIAQGGVLYLCCEDSGVVKLYKAQM